MSPSKRIRSAIARRARIEDAAARAQLRLLEELRREILRELATAEDFRLFRLQTMLQVIDHEIRRFEPQAAGDVAAAIQQAWAAGGDMVIGAPSPSLFGVSRNLLQSLIEVTSEQTKAVWTELGGRLKSQIRRATLGLTDPFDAMANVARLIKDPKTFGTAFNRAETIVRTEVNRSFAMATNDRSKEADLALSRAGERLVKWWLSAKDTRVRPAHRDAAKRYSKENPIPVDQPFIVGGEELMHPLDPNGSPANTANCRCVELTRVVSAEEFAALPRAA